MSVSLLSRAYVYLVALCVAAGLVSLGVPSQAVAEECPNAAFRTGPSTHLPDCRAYELVSPPFKDAGAPKVESLSPDGSSALLAIGGAILGLEGFPGVGAFRPEGFYSTHRTASGWTTVADEPPSSEYRPVGWEGQITSGLTLWSLDGQTTVWTERAGRQPANSAGLFLRRPDRSVVEAGPSVPPTTPLEPPLGLGAQAHIEVKGVSSDASHILFSINKYYWPFDGTVARGSGAASLYEYVGTGNTTPMLVGVNDSGGLIGQCGDALGAGEPERGGAHNAVSTDGSTVFFTVLPRREACASASAPPVGELFARIDNGLADAHTVAISEPSKGDCSACDTEAGVLASATFLAASENGSKVFFATQQPLLGGAAGPSIYEYDFDAPAGDKVRLVGLEGGLIQVSEDGSHVYFGSTDVLTLTPNNEGQTAQPGAGNVYVYDTETRDTAFITDGELSQSNVTPDGRFLVFTSGRDLTPDDTSSGVWQVFEYNAQTGALVRVSIGQDGFNHDGNAAAKFNVFHQVVNNAEIVTPIFNGGSMVSNYWGHLSVSADGAYVFFQSIVGLTPQALDQQVIGHTGEQTNGEEVHLPIYAMNVYEYHAGRVSLITDGQDLAHNSVVSVVRLFGTDESGGDVLFATTDQLVGQDTDDNLDIYDARVNGGFPAPAVPPSCSGEACQGELSGAPTLLSPGSEFQVGGNPPLAAPVVSKPAVKPKAKAKSKKCKQGTPPRHGRCVKAKGRIAKRAANERRARS